MVFQNKISDSANDRRLSVSPTPFSRSFAAVNKLGDTRGGKLHPRRIITAQRPNANNLAVDKPPKRNIWKFRQKD
jgi:hypothetical protein